MSPPEYWGPPVWTFFHVLAEKYNENTIDIRFNQFMIHQIYQVIRHICGYLPCPECSKDATIFLSKINPDKLNKEGLKQMLYVFHNYVNNKKRKNIFDYKNMNIYQNINILQAFNKFISVYNTRGNMNQLNESFQRKFVIKNTKK